MGRPARIDFQLPGPSAAATKPEDPMSPTRRAAVAVTAIAAAIVVCSVPAYLFNHRTPADQAGRPGDHQPEALTLYSGPIRDNVGDPIKPRKDYPHTDEIRYTVHLIIQGEQIPDAKELPALHLGAAGEADLIVLLRILATRYAANGRQVQVQIWNTAKKRWHHPLGANMPDNWDGVLPVTITVNVGTARF